MRSEARQPAIARCDLGGSGGTQNFWGVFWVSEIDSDAISSCLACYIARLLYLTVLRKQHYKFFTNSALHTPNIAHAAVQRVH